ncbi:MAG: hypothetical protein AABX12_02345 [Nanoarchaeota archaeon]
MNSKTRRHSGRKTPRFKNKKEILIKEGLEPQPYWNDWLDYRDGVRGCDDRKMLRDEHMHFSNYFDVKRWNKKLRLLILRRKARKASPKSL